MLIQKKERKRKRKKRKKGTEVGYTGIEKDKASPNTNYTYIIYKETMATIFFMTLSKDFQ